MSRINDPIYPLMTVLAPGDVLPAVDVSDITQSALGTTKRLTVAALQGLQPSGDVTGATDTANIQGLLNAAGPGDAVLLGNARFVTSAQLTIPAGVTLAGPSRTMAYPGGNYGIGGVPIQGAIIAPVGAMAAAVQFASSGSTQLGNHSLRRLTIDGTNMLGGTGHGLLADAVAGVTLEDVSVLNCPGDGLHGVGVGGTGGHPPDFWSVARCKFSACGGCGVLITGMADSFFTDTEATGNRGAAAWSVINGNNNRWVACKGEQSVNGHGWLLTANSGFTGLLHLLTCTSQFNNQDGFHITGAGTGTYQLLGCAADSEGTNGGTGGGGFAGLRVTGFAGTVIVNGFDVRVSGSPLSPQYGISADTSGSVIVGNASLNGASAALLDGGGNTLLQVDSGQFGRFPSAAQLGIAAQNYPSFLALGGSAAATSGLVYVMRVPLRGGAVPITNILAGIQTAGGTLTAGQCFAGLYDNTGAKLGGTTDQSASWVSTGVKTMAISGGPVTTSAPFVYVVLLANGTTPPAWARAGGGALVSSLTSLSAAGANMPFATNGSGATALPASLSYVSNTTTSSQPIWVGLS
jgi:hypothetical protein